MTGSRENGHTVSLSSLASGSGNCCTSEDGMGVGASTFFLFSAAAQPSWSMMLVHHYWDPSLAMCKGNICSQILQPARPWSLGVRVTAEARHRAIGSICVRVGWFWVLVSLGHCPWWLTLIVNFSLIAKWVLNHHGNIPPGYVYECVSRKV